MRVLILLGSAVLLWLGVQAIMPGLYALAVKGESKRLEIQAVVREWGLKDDRLY